MSFNMSISNVEERPIEPTILLHSNFLTKRVVLVRSRPYSLHLRIHKILQLAHYMWVCCADFVVFPRVLDEIEQAPLRRACQLRIGDGVARS